MGEEGLGRAIQRDTMKVGRLQQTAEWWGEFWQVSEAERPSAPYSTEMQREDPGGEGEKEELVDHDDATSEG